MARQTAVLSWLVRQPSVGFQFLGISPVYVEITQRRLLYRSFKEYCYWSRIVEVTSGIYYSYGLFGSVGYSTVGHMPGNYVVTVGSIYFTHKDGSAYLKFTGRHPIHIAMNTGGMTVCICRGPLEIRKRIKHPGIPMRDTLEDAQAILTYLLKLKDQMIELGY